MDEIVLDEKMYDKAVKGYTMFTDNYVTIIGERVVSIDGNIKEQYIYTIDGYEAKNGKPFVSLKANIILV